MSDTNISKNINKHRKEKKRFSFVGILIEK